MVDPTSVALGAGAVYILVLHMTVTYLAAALKASRDSVSATEADVLSGGQS